MPIADRFNVGSKILGNVNFAMPEKIHFTNNEDAVEIYNRAVQLCAENKGKYTILIHADIDFDGIASAYLIWYDLVRKIGRTSVGVSINIKREHGIKQKFVETINNSIASGAQIALTIIVDSSTNELGNVLALSCDTLVIDHHELEIGAHQTVGVKPNGYKYAIINKEIDGLADMSGAQVVYEWLRYNGAEQYLLAEKLYSWVAVSLFSDVIDADNEKNQWFIQETVQKGNFESTLNTLFESGHAGCAKLKGDIQFMLVPIINAAIRMGKSTEVLDCVINHPTRLNELAKYKAEQAEKVSNLLSSAYIGQRLSLYPEVGFYELLETDDAEGFEGLIATRLQNLYQRTIFVFQHADYGIRGSFRVAGKSLNFDLRRLLNEQPSMKASGHRGAFGFEVHKVLQNDTPMDLAMRLVNTVSKLNGMYGNTVVADDAIKYVEVKSPAEMRELKRSFELVAMANINARMTSKKAMIKVPNTYQNVSPLDLEGKMLFYDILGQKAVSFNDINIGSGSVWLYPEIGTYLNVYIDGVRE